MSTDKPTVDKVREFLNQKLDSGYQVIDKNSAKELQKMAVDEFSLTGGWRDRTKHILQSILKARNVVLPDTKSSEPVGSLRINVEKSSQDLVESQPPIQTPSSPVLPMPETGTFTQTEREPQIIWDDAKKLTYQKDMEKVFGDFIGTIYIKFGIIEGEEPVEEKLTPQKFKEQAKEVGKDIGEYCFDKHVQLPELLRVLTLVGSVFMVFGMPLINNLFFKMKKPPTDKSLQSVADTV